MHGARGVQTKGKKASAPGVKMDTHSVPVHKPRQKKQVAYSSCLTLTNHHQSIYLGPASFPTACKMMSLRCGFALPENT